MDYGPKGILTSYSCNLQYLTHHSKQVSTDGNFGTSPILSVLSMKRALHFVRPGLATFGGVGQLSVGFEPHLTLVNRFI